MNATWLLHEGSGSPLPTSAEGDVVSRSKTFGRCARCGAERAEYDLSEAVSDNFTPTANASRLWGFGGEHMCCACLWACKAMPFRCSLFFGTKSGVAFLDIRPFPGMPETRPRAIRALLCPPEPPFVAGLPLYGVDHGGEANISRTLLSWDDVPRVTLSDIKKVAKPLLDALIKDAPPSVKPEHAKRQGALGMVYGYKPWPTSGDWDALARLFAVHGREYWWRAAVWPLVKLQSKPLVLYCRVSTSRSRYWLQVDDTGGFMLDVPTWQVAYDVAAPLIAAMLGDGVFEAQARDALRTLQPPARLSLPNLASWSKRVRPLQQHVSSLWWDLFCDLL